MPRLKCAPTAPRILAPSGHLSIANSAVLLTQSLTPGFPLSQRGLTALHLAVMGGSVDCLAALAEKGADTEAKLIVSSLSCRGSQLASRRIFNSKPQSFRSPPILPAQLRLMP
jgi:ankyrin repeat protein